MDMEMLELKILAVILMFIGTFGFIWLRGLK